MKIENKIRTIYNFAIKAGEIRNYWRKTRDFVDVDYYCSRSIFLFNEIRKFGHGILEEAFFQGGFDCDFDFDAFGKFKRDDIKDIGKNAFALWREMLIKLKPDGTINFLLIKENAQTWNTTFKKTYKSDKEFLHDKDNTKLLFYLSNKLFFEIELALADTISNLVGLGIACHILDLHWILQEAYYSLIWESETCGPYVLNTGKNWAKPLSKSDLDNHYGMLSIIPKSLEHKKINCTFRCLDKQIIRVESWEIALDELDTDYETKLFRTWAFNSGLYFEYPRENDRAFWKINGGEDITFEHEMVPDIIDALKEDKKYENLANETEKVFEPIENLRLYGAQLGLIEWRRTKCFEQLRKDIEFHMLAVEPTQKLETVSGKIGRPKKYSDDDYKLMKNLHDEEYQITNDSRGAWNKAANILNISSGDAARVAYMNYRRRAKTSR